ncbi:AT-hook motif nuclear-localized protein 28-like [Lolium perenne]|jgi:predicted DNA-binding protein with PD1-like motif|uniref:AT-hook motif nuclear-localized protein 28-like n=1 Tax=Lolium perenne TaxID=4522 RepID=UPI0021EB1376|nr:AT-hook motif nuclear-localized protein 28-like [Lolium perenne]
MDGAKLYTDQPQQLERMPECFSGEVSSRDDGAEETKDASNPPAAATGRDDGGSSIETGKKRARGRPPGSKNRPKQPAEATPVVPEPAAAMRPYILEIPGGGDVSAALAGFARRRGLGVCVLAGTGAVADVSLRHPSAEGGAAIVFRGRHEILSISATYLPPSVSAAAPRALGGLSVALAGPHGQILGGAVAGPLVAATTVMVVAATFTNPSFHRLSADDVDASASVSGSSDAGKLQLEPQGQHQASRLQPHGMSAAAMAAQPVSLYGAQSYSHVARAPAASKPRPPPPYE